MRRFLGKIALERLEVLEDRLLLSAGDLDVVFAGGKATANFSLGAAQVQALAVQADGRIVAAGQAGSSGSEFALARFNRNGTLDPGFGTAGEVTTLLGSNANSAARGVAIQPDGKILGGPEGTGDRKGQYLKLHSRQAVAEKYIPGVRRKDQATGGEECVAGVAIEKSVWRARSNCALGGSSCRRERCRLTTRRTPFTKRK